MCQQFGHDDRTHSQTALCTAAATAAVAIRYLNKLTQSWNQRSRFVINWKGCHCEQRQWGKGVTVGFLCVFDGCVNSKKNLVTSKHFKVSQFTKF